MSDKMREALDNSQSLLVMVYQIGANPAVWGSEGIEDLISTQVAENRAVLDQAPPSRPVTAGAEATEIPFNILLTEDGDPISTPPTATGREEMARVVCRARGYDLATEQYWAAKSHAASINIVRDAFNVADAVLALSPQKLGTGEPVKAVSQPSCSDPNCKDPLCDYDNEPASRSSEGEVEVLRDRILELETRINTPQTADWLAAVPLEAAHQIERYGVMHDAGKTAWDWFWLIGYLAQKAADAAVRQDPEKAKHHTISTAAALLNWHRRLCGEDLAMRPGIADPTLPRAERGTGL